jgi:hypothetical protein
MPMFNEASWSEEAPIVERRVAVDPARNAARRASDVAIVMNGEVALLTLEGFLETAAHLAKIVLDLDRRERERAAKTSS